MRQRAERSRINDEEVRAKAERIRDVQESSREGGLGARARDRVTRGGPNTDSAGAKMAEDDWANQMERLEDKRAK
ncbi:MAG TPA: hypothetical protein VFD73_16275, partial [Gemmatimonadales bacterium]|nr:hypothetical protein [Gemmatimonadales bacterium]